MKNLRRFLALLTTIVFLSCGNEKKEQESIRIGEEGTIQESQSDPRSVNNTTRGEVADTAQTGSNENIQRRDGVVQINLTGDDQMRFNMNEIRVRAGETVRVTLRHTGQLPKNAMGHNFVLLQKDADVTDFGQRAASASGNDYIPQGSDEVIAHTELIGGGEETSVEFTAPEAGTYTFICSFPGHFVQMRGQFIVEEA